MKSIVRSLQILLVGVSIAAPSFSHGRTPITATPHVQAPERTPPSYLVEWHGSLWSASVVRELAPNIYKIHYVGWGNEWDEIVECDRLFRASAVRSGDAKMVVEWGGQYWSAQPVRLESDGTIRVHYTGWDEKWDENVTKARIAYTSSACGGR